MQLEAAPELRKRARRINEHPVKTDGADFVLCWLQQNLRANDNPIVDAAIAAGNKYRLPVVVYHALGQRYPHANRRIHQFILEAAATFADEFAARNLRFVAYVERPAKFEKGLVYRLANRAAMIVTDDIPAFAVRFQTESVAKKVQIPIVAVDASCLVPMNEFPYLTDANAFFRRAHSPLREQYLNARTELTPEISIFAGDFDFEPDDLRALNLSDLLDECDIDQTVLPAPKFRGSRASALAQLKFAIEKVLPVYDKERNNSAGEFAGARLSPYLHFGVLSVREIVKAVNDATVSARAKWKFLDELLSWREFFHHTARHSANPAAYENLPDWARETLEKHADERTGNPNLNQLIHGETGDETWDAAQKQYLLEGWMPNNLRMYWGKKIVGWRETPELAWRTACYLNDRFSLDGRDAATYGNLQWAFGRFDRPASEARIYGKISRRSDNAMRARDGMNEYLKREAARETYRVFVPDEV